MKRSDSVNKRVSVQQSGALSRGDSFSRRGANGSAPTETPQGSSGSLTKEDPDSFVKPALPSRSTQSEREEPGLSEPQRAETPTRSHSRTDSKRWSPTKSSWLEAAISKTDSPKPKPAVSQQPSWMVDLNKAKQARGSVDLGKSTAHKEVEVGGLLRSPPMGSPTKSQSLPSATKPPITSPKPSLTDKTPKPANDTKEAEQGEKQVEGGKDKEEESTDSKPTPSASLKQKPETPPKKDFRSSLKSRAPPPSSGQSNEPEFKNVFGKLKHTQTKNFVAEDVFKNNILQGKAGLNTTGGPRPWVKKDEFKDSIMAKKKEMREGTSVVNTGNVKEAQGPAVPEALAKRQNMSAKPVGQGAAPVTEVPEALAKRQNITTRPGSITSRVSQSSVQSARSSKAPATTETSSASESQPGALEHEKPEQAEEPLVTKQKSQAEESVSKPETRVSQIDTSRPVKPARGASSSSSSSSKLADRFNPALAGILARGPPGSGAGSPSRDAEPTKAPEESHQSSGALTHATKARARGPKRRAPQKTSADPAAMPAVQEEKKAIDSGKEQPSTPETYEATITAEPKEQPTKPKSYASNAPGGMKSIAASVASTAKVRSTGQGNSSTPNSRTLPTKINTIIGTRQGQVDSTTSGTESPGNKSQVSSPGATKKLAAEKSPQLASPKSPPMPGKKPETLLRISSNPKSPALEKKASAKEENKPATSPITSRQKLSLNTSDKKAAPVPRKQSSPETPKASVVGQKSPGPKPSARAGTTAASAIAAASAKPGPAETQLNALKAKDDEPMRPKTMSQTHQDLSKFFSQPLKSTADSKLNVDTQAILLNAPTPEKIKTLRMEIWEVTGDGKKITMPSDQSHVLFENSMFLCSHVFGAANGKRTTEVYLWCGSGVSPSSVEDAQLFCRNAAREAGSKLIIVEQGKEPSAFFEALGGIVITRVGSPSSASNSRYVLCGRRHMGQIAFDEVAFTPKALCSGFPHIVAAADGSRVYLWKGKGSGTDELGCARLIAMDLGPAGDIEEVDEGAEPAAFWKAFASSDTRGAVASEQWAQKAVMSAKYATRLFAVDLNARPKSSGSGFMQWARRASTPVPEESGEQVREIAPYTQADVTADGVFVLDSFFELFV